MQNMNWSYHILCDKASSSCKTEAAEREVACIQRQVPGKWWIFRKIFVPYNLDTQRYVTFDANHMSKYAGYVVLTSKPASLRAARHCFVYLISGRPSPISISACYHEVILLDIYMSFKCPIKRQKTCTRSIPWFSDALGYWGQMHQSCTTRMQQKTDQASRLCISLCRCQP